MVEKSPTEVKHVTFSDQKIYFTETLQSEDFKTNVCIPYFKDIFKVIINANNLKGSLQQVR